MGEVHRAVQAKNTDGFVIACYGDPGVHAAREITDIPVVGIAEASMYMACLVAPKFSIISILDRCDYTLEQMLYEYGMERRCASIRATGLSVLEAETDPEKTIRELTRQSEIAIKEDHAEALLLGCAGMVPFTKELEQKFGVPVFDGVIAAVKILEGLIGLGKKTSKIRTYAPPAPKEYVGLKGILPY
jgi:allantoin racemase